MRKYGLQYGFLVCFTVGFFMNFIACGSQLYQVSVEEDFEESRTLASNPEVNNPESTVYGIHAISGWKQLPIRYRFGDDMTPEQRSHLYAAMRKWENAIGKKLFEFDGVDQGRTGNSFPDLYSSLNDEVNGHYLDNDWVKTAKPSYVLATTIWNNAVDTSAIAKADIRFNTEGYLIGDSLILEPTDGKEVVDMQSLALHELGHLLGLAHIDPKVDRLSIMNPSLLIGEGLTTRKISRGDIVRIQTIYGCQGKACDIDTLVREEENPESDPELVDLVSGKSLSKNTAQ